ncbi:NAD(P)-binding protein [bacterium]|nr:NAD(P)-binding protein [bacterium]
MKAPFAITLDVGSSLLNKTGSWRNQRPLYVDRLPPCNHACPAGENIQQWLYLAEEGRYEEAWRQIMDDNPFPTVMGRVCYHPCESACNRGHLDEAVGINAIERFLGDQAIKHEWQMNPGKPTGKRVMIVGAGPGGLAAAYHLRRLGHHVTIYDASPQAGGMLRYGIPRYRLPREKLNAEIARIKEMGVDIQLNSRIDDIPATKNEGKFNAVFLALGAQLPKRVEIPVKGKVAMLDAVTVLRNMELEEPTGLRGRVVVYGGGNTAMDVARTAIRLGARDVSVVTIEAEEQMPAHIFEVNEAREEGATLICLRAIREVRGNEVILEKMVPGEGRWPQPTGQFESIEADIVVQALGQNVETVLMDGVSGIKVVEGTVQVDADMQTGARGIFAGGDMIPSQRTVTTSIGHGKKAARHIDAVLRGAACAPADKHEVVTFDMLNTWYYSDAPRTVRPMLSVIRRQSGFAEIIGDIDRENATFEARRCMSCGNCFECDNCYGVCPDNAIRKLGPGNRFEFKYDYCKGCGICPSECPCGAIMMMPEEI